MTKKKRNHPDVEEVLARPWCYYCERDFDDLKILINHQKAKHFKCERCGRRLNTAGGLSVHMSQVHKENLSAVDNALPNRAGLDIEIFGMEGIPEDIVSQHTQRVLQNFHQAEAERRAASGNQGPGAPGGGQTKKPKFESPAELKKRLAEHKARMADQTANGGSSGSGTPIGAGQGPPAQAQNNLQSGSPQYPQYQQPYNAQSAQPAYAPPPVQQPYGSAPAQQQYGVPPPQQYNGPPASLPYSQPQLYAQAPAPVQPYQQQPIGYPSQPAFSPPPFQSQSPYPPQKYSPSQPFSPMMQSGPPQWQGPPGGPPRAFSAGSPVNQFQHQNQMPPRTHTPPQNGLPPRSASGNLLPAPGLPQRPAFQAPPVSMSQFQQMHHGQIPVPQNGSQSQQSFAQQNPQSNGNQQHSSVPPPAVSQQQESSHATSLDDLISDASKRAESATPSVLGTNVDSPAAHAAAVPAAVKEEAADDKKDGKRDKDKSKLAKLVYSDNEISPEEKMAMMPRYAYTPDKNAIRV